MSSSCVSAVHTFDRGLFLEDRSLLLPWGARRHHLLHDCHPDRWKPGLAYDKLFWHNVEMLSGLKVPSLHIVLYPYGWFESAWVPLAGGACPSKADHAFQDTLTHLLRVLGPPSPGSRSISLCRPTQLPKRTAQPPHDRTLSWGWRTTHVTLVLRSAEQPYNVPFSCVLHISHREE